MRRIPASISDDRLAGGLDVAATIRTGRPVAEPGVLALADGGVLVLAMAERASPRVAARLAAALDRDQGCARRPFRRRPRVGLVALDEGSDDSEAPPAILLERCAYIVDLSDVGFRDIEGEDDEKSISRPRARGSIASPPIRMGVAALVAVAARMGIASLRAPLMALRAARAIAALDGRTQIEDDDVALAATLTLSPRATRLPEAGAGRRAASGAGGPGPATAIRIPTRITNPEIPRTTSGRPLRSRMSCSPPRRLRFRPLCWRRSKRARSREANRRARANPARRKFRLAADARSPPERARRVRGG